MRLPPLTLRRAWVGALTGAVSSAGLLLAWPTPVGVIWTPSELSELAALGAAVGGVLGLLLGLTSGRSQWWGAASCGLIPVLLLRVAPHLPTDGIALVRVPTPVLGMWLGTAVVMWGLLRLVARAWVHPVVAVGVGLLLAGTWPQSPSSPQTAGPGPDLLLITVDTTRADLVPGFAGDLPPAEMPALARWRTGARIFTEAYAPTALTGPSHTSILSGQHAVEHGILANGRTIPPESPWVPSELHKAGWNTQAWVSTAVLDAQHGFARGFHGFDSRFVQRLLYGHPVLQVWPRRRSGGTGFVRPDAQTVDRALAAGLHDPSGQTRTFTWVHLYGPHWPYTPDSRHAAALGVSPVLDTPTHGPVPLNQSGILPPAVRDHAIALYRAELRTLDDQLGRLLDAAGPDTLVVIAGDHGESLDEHGLYFNHGRLSTAPTARVPLLVRGPDYPPGTEDRLVSLHQIAPTLRQLAGLPARGAAAPLSEAAGDAVVRTVSSAEVFADEDTPHPALGGFASVSVRADDWTRTASAWHAEVWTHRPTDPRELGTVQELQPPASVRTRIQSVWDETIQQPVAPLPAVDPQTQEALEALGYLNAGE